MMIYRLFYPLILLKAALMIAVILYGGIGLGPDEAQYWTWSRHLDWGYYSKPPGIAWQIFASTSLLGSNELGVRFGAVVIGTLFAYSVFRLAKKSGSSPIISAFSGLLAAFTPLGIFSTFLTITDGGLLLFWTLALTELSVAIYEKKPPSWVLFGVFIACGALFKWPIYILWIIALVLYVFYPFTRTNGIFIGFIISLLGLLPTLQWNINHDFATFRHVGTIIQGGNDGGSHGNPLEFIGSQFAIVSPIILVMGCYAVFYIRSCPQVYAFLGSISVSILGFYIGYSFFKKGQGNWCLFAYPSFFVFISAFFAEKKKGKWGLLYGLLLSISLCCIAFFIPILQRKSWLKTTPIAWKQNIFKHNLGWKALQDSLEGFDPKTQFLCADKYQMTSLLSFYNDTQDQGYFFNILGSRKNQFSYWPEPEMGKDGIFVVVENAPNLNEKVKALESFYLEKLKDYFVKIHPPERISLFEAYGQSVKEALIFRCDHFLGTLPDAVEKY